MRVLAANFFPAFHPPSSGGEQRYYYLYRHLSEWHDVTLLSPTYSTHAAERVAITSTFREHRVPKEGIFDRLHWTLATAGIGPECSGYVVSLGAAHDTAFGREFSALVDAADVVIHDSPFTLPYDRTIGTDGKPRIYNAYNVEYHLARQFFQGPVGEKAIDFIRFLERELTRQASFVFVTSPEEGRQFQSEFGVGADRIVLVPNGFEPTPEPEASPSIPRRGNYALFMGSAHPPNVEAARFIVTDLAPRMPEVEFRVIGGVCSHLPNPLPANVAALGFVEEPVKRALLQGCGAAINPLFSGAGTNLKMLDYMASGAPVVSTPLGARGLDLVAGVDVFIARGEQFASTLREVLVDRDRASQVGIAAQRRAMSEYTWDRVATRVKDVLDRIAGTPAAPTPGRSNRPFLLVVNDFSVLDPTGGGQVRINALLTQLGQGYEVVLLCLTGEDAPYERPIARGVTEVGIPKTIAHRDAEVAAARGESVSVDDVLAGEFVLANEEFVTWFVKLSARSAAIVFEHPFLQALVASAPPNVPIVYSSLNIESDLKATLLAPRRDGLLWSKRVVQRENALVEKASLVICVSSEDRTRLLRDHPGKRAIVVHNGAHVARGSGRQGPRNDDDRRAGGTDRPMAVFVGSAHMPNVHAARFIVETLASQAEDVAFAIVGPVCNAIRLWRLPRNVALFGTMTVAEKDALLERAAIALNPLFEGGGSSLKVPDYLCHGLALVSTAVGVRGYELQDKVHYLLAGPGDFGDQVRRLVESPELRTRIGSNGKAFASRELDWRILGGKYLNAVRALTQPCHRIRALCVTYRFADPGPGGAEAYLANALREIGRRGNIAVDVIAPDVQSIVNKWHFSADYDSFGVLPPVPDSIDSLWRFPLDRPPDDTFAKCSKLFALWMDETREQARLLREHFHRPVLMGGWNFEERTASGFVRWTSRCAEVYVGTRAESVWIEGFSPSSSHIEFRDGARILERLRVSGRFTVEIALRGAGDTLSMQVRDVLEQPSDPRELGVLVSEIVVRTGEEDVRLHLGEDFSSLVRRATPSTWVNSLMALTRQRREDLDALFVQVRGPHSVALEHWLAARCRDYQVILVQGVPFSTLAVATEIASEHQVPTVLLPHFHLEDRYYHWLSYYRAFDKAHCVLAAPASSKAFFEQLGARALEVPGGGLDLREHDDETRIACGMRMFRALHADTKPFALVLGRKAGAKNYRQVVEAIQRVNAGTERASVVLIGPDDDGVPVTAPGTYYYGEQPRDVVLAALRLAACLVNMSDSESFGIVLLEAWRSGTPVVVQRRCAAFADLVEDGKNGWVVESVDEIAAAIDRYLSDPVLADEHAARGSKLAERFSWGHVATVIEQALLEAASTGADLPRTAAAA